MFPVFTDWHITIVTLTAAMLLCVAIAVICRQLRKRRAARIAFILFIGFLLSAFTMLLVYANRIVDKNKGIKVLNEEKRQEN